MRTRTDAQTSREILTDNPRTRALLHHLATRPGHDEVKSDFRQLLVEEFGVELGALDFEPVNGGLRLHRGAPLATRLSGGLNRDLKLIK